MPDNPSPLRALNIFNRYLERGGEEEAVTRIAEGLDGVMDLRQCFFSSADWTARRVPAALQALWMIRNPASIAALRREQREANFDFWLVHNVFPVGSAAVYREAGRLGVPIVQYCHNFRPFSVNGYLWACDRLAPGGLRLDFRQEIRCAAWQQSRAKTAWFAAVLRLMHALGWWRNVRAWVAISDFMRAKLIEAGLPDADVFTVRYCWRPQPVIPQPQDDGHYLFLGRLISAKGVEVLFKTWELLETALGPGTPRLLIGGDGPLREQVAARAEASRFIHYAGQLGGEAKRQAILGSRALLAPSLWWEALGLVTYEAYDFAKPVLAARSGGLTETVVHGRTGLLHEPGDAGELAAQIMELDPDAERRAAMGRQGREWLEQHTDEASWRQKFRVAVEHAVNRRQTNRA